MSWFMWLLLTSLLGAAGAYYFVLLPQQQKKSRKTQLERAQRRKESNLQAQQAQTTLKRQNMTGLDDIPCEECSEMDHVSLIKQKGGMMNFVQYCHDKYGPIVKFRIGDDTAVSINDPELIADTVKLAGRPKELFRFLEPLLGANNLQVMKGADAKLLRRVANQPYRSALISKFDSFLQATKEVVQQIEDANGAPIDIQQFLLTYAFKIAVKVAFGSENVDNIDFDRFFDAYTNAIEFAIDKQLNRDTTTTEQEHANAISFINSTIEDFINNSDSEKDTLISVLKTKKDPCSNKPFDLETAKSLLTGYVLAAYHTSVVATSWTLFELTKHPEVQQRVQEEIDSVLKGECPESASQLGQLSYMLQVAKESLRLYPPGPFAARLVSEDDGDCEIKDEYLLPVGTTIYYPIASIHKNPKCWSNPDLFNPDRFLPQNAKSRPNGAYCPFGIGPRACPGERLAWLEMRLLLSMLLQRFTIKLEMDESEVIPQEKFVLWAKNDIKISFTKR